MIDSQKPRLPIDLIGGVGPLMCVSVTPGVAEEEKREMENHFPINQSRGQLREDERRRRRWPPFIGQRGSVNTAEDHLIYSGR